MSEILPRSGLSIEQDAWGKVFSHVGKTMVRTCGTTEKDIAGYPSARSGTS
jgi:hypothetical protein